MSTVTNMNTTNEGRPTYFGSYPLHTLVETPPEWAINLLADLYQPEVNGTHGFGLPHPRACWLTLVVSSVEECCRCSSPDVRWEDKEVGAFCRDCAETEIVVTEARMARVHALAREVDRLAVPHPMDAVETTPIGREAMRTVVEGRLV